MKILLIVLGGIVALILIVVAIGLLLPKRHTASRSALFKASADKLFTLIAGQQDWRPDLKTYERGRDEAGNECIKETSRRGETVTYQIVLRDPPRRYAVRIADKSLPYGGQWTYVLEPQGDRTNLRITEDGEVYNPVFRFVSRFLIGHTRTIDNYMRALASQTGDHYQTP